MPRSNMYVSEHTINTASTLGLASTYTNLGAPYDDTMTRVLSATRCGKRGEFYEQGYPGTIR